MTTVFGIRSDGPSEVYHKIDDSYAFGIYATHCGVSSLDLHITYSRPSDKRLCKRCAKIDRETPKKE